MSDLCKKYLQARKRGNKNILLYKALDEANEANPLDISAIKTSFPYFPKAKTFDNSIYKLNVPGYFYRNVDGNQNTSTSGVVLSYKASNIDVYALGIWDRTIQEQASEGCNFCGWSQSTDTVDLFADHVVSEFTGAYAVPANARKADISSNHDRINLFVSGKGIGGGHSNQFFPVIPGDSGDGKPNSMAGFKVYVTGENKVAKELILNGDGITGSVSYDIPYSDDSGANIVDETIGTFVYWCDDSSQSKFYVPCHCSKDICESMTKVRTCSKNFGYELKPRNPISSLYDHDYYDPSVTITVPADSCYNKKTNQYEPDKKTGDYATKSYRIDCSPELMIPMYFLLKTSLAKCTLKSAVKYCVIDPYYVNTWHIVPQRSTSSRQIDSSLKSGFLTNKNNSENRAITVFDACFKNSSMAGYSRSFKALSFGILPEMYDGLIFYTYSLGKSHVNTDGTKVYLSSSTKKRESGFKEPIPSEVSKEVPDSFWKNASEYNITQVELTPAK